MKRLWLRLGSAALCLLSLAAVFAALNLLGIGCPIKFLTGISCPGCGMTRAMWCLLTLRFSDALAYHPLCVAMPPILALLTYSEIRKKPRAQRTVLASMVALLLAVYLWRLLHGGDEVVSWAPSEGWLLVSARRLLVYLFP